MKKKLSILALGLIWVLILGGCGDDAGMKETNPQGLRGRMTSILTRFPASRALLKR